MFDFPRWRDWMQEWVGVHRAEFSELRSKVRMEYLPAMVLEFESPDVVAGFRFWENALVDFEVLDLSTKEWIANEAGIAVDDASFEHEFQRFLTIAGCAASTPALSDAQVETIKKRLADSDERTQTPAELRSRVDKLLP